jgi:predicted nuclease of restriction endonuclease-like (RecB) superfamily
MREAAEQHWSSRQLDRQISVLYYERLLANPAPRLTVFEFLKIDT